MAFERITSTVDGDDVLVLTMSEPERLNVLGEIMVRELEAEIDRFATDGSLKCLVITGEGRAFSAGADVRGFKKRADAQSTSAEPAPPGPWELLDAVYRERQRRETTPEPHLITMLQTLEKPSIAAVNGLAYGMGNGVALSCDLRVASTEAKFCEAFIRNGLVPGDGSTWQLPKIIGLGRALWMEYSGEPVGGEEAFTIGLANRVVAPDQLMAEALTMAHRLAEGPIFAMGLVKQLLQRGYSDRFDEHAEMAKRANTFARRTHDHRESVTAFVEKRKPKFEGR